jgi:RibD domain-containing protein
MSLDGYTAGPEQTRQDPLGIGGEGLHQWVFPLAAWRKPHGLQGGEVNESNAVVEEELANIGATIMGRNRANAARQYLAAGLVDEMELHLVPILLGGGERLFEGLRELKDLRLVRTVAAPNVTHLKFSRSPERHP